jgi:hypothetical protein
MFNGMDRIEEKESEYFNVLQPYQYHSNTPRQGIYVYSFALYPEDLQPSGVFNAAVISKIQLYLTMQPKIAEDVDAESSYDYDVVVYSVVNNIFRVMSGSGSIAYAM